ncbi:13832_t:CDS:2, partial [Entrophospora sp. SA101]
MTFASSSGDEVSYVKSRAPRGPTSERGFIGREAIRERYLAEKASKELNTSSNNHNNHHINNYNPQIDEEHNGSKNGLGDFEYHQKGFDLQ